MKKLLICLTMILIARYAGGCILWHTTTTYDGSEKAYGMHPEWTDHQPDYMPNENGDPPDN